MMPRLVLAFTALLVPLLAAAQAPQPIPVSRLASMPVVDGKLADWGKTAWIEVAVAPALTGEERAKHGLDENDQNVTGKLKVQMKAGVAGDRFFVALRYPDDLADTVHRPFQWQNEKYIESKAREDMFALRFHLSGAFDRSMLTDKDYKVDVWLWSAARTNPSGIAEDMQHRITTEVLDSAAEYQLPNKKTVFIEKRRDAGNPPYRMLPRPRTHSKDKIPSFEAALPAGSAADVAAKGEWKAGYWNLEFSRALDTGHPDDVAFRPGQKLLGQIAVFNRGHSEHKSISEPLLFDFTDIK